MADIQHIGVDTHTLIWATLAPDKLGRKARRVLEGASPESIGIPATVVRELRMLLALDKTGVDGDPLSVFTLILNHWPQVPISLRAALKAPRDRSPSSRPL